VAASGAAPLYGEAGATEEVGRFKGEKTRKLKMVQRTEAIGAKALMASFLWNEAVVEAGVDRPKAAAAGAFRPPASTSFGRRRWRAFWLHLRYILASSGTEMNLVSDTELNWVSDTELNWVSDTKVE